MPAIVPQNVVDTNNNPPFIVAFYDEAIDRPDFQGRDIDQILSMSDSQLEYSHDFIQILFPLPEPSPVNPWAPVITKDIRDTFHYRWELRDRLRESLNRMLRFFGFSDLVVNVAPPSRLGRIYSISYEIHPDSNQQEFEERSLRTWRKRFTHNHLRITRMIRSMRVLGEDGAARAFLAALRRYDPEGLVSERSRMYWDRALNRPIHLPPDEEDENAEGISWLREPVGFERRARNADELERVCRNCGGECPQYGDCLYLDG